MYLKISRYYVHTFCQNSLNLVEYTKSIQVRGESPRTEPVRDTSLAVNNVKPSLLQNLGFKNVRCCGGGRDGRGKFA